MMSNQSAQPMPGERLRSNRAPVARHGWPHRWAQGSDTPFDNMKACTIHMIMIVVWLTVGCRTMDREASWEYTRTNDFSRLQELAKEGWALDSWHALGSNDGGTMYIMKRKAH
jgi:hypothetical protein